MTAQAPGAAVVRSEQAVEAAEPRSFFPIETQRQRVPWPWLLMMTAPGLASGYIEFCSAGPLTFTIKKFVSDPALITFLISINTLFNFLVGTWAAYCSDHIWTRFGRRRVFIVPGWIGVAACMFFVPLMPGIVPLAILIVVYQFCQDFGASSVNAMSYEVVPPNQRGRFATFVMIVSSLAGLFNNLVLLAQFDRKYHLNVMGYDLHISGEQVLYWYGSMFVLVIVAFLAFCVRERKPAVLPPKFSVSPRTFFREAYGPRDFRILLTLCIGVAVSVVGMGTNNVLLVTDQFGFSKAQLGHLSAINMIANILLLAPLVGFFVDRLPRLRLTMFGIIGMVMTNVTYFLFLRLVLDGRPPSFGIVVAHSIIHASFGVCYSMSHGPNVYDYVTSNRYGTWQAALTLLNGILLFVLPNLYGLWVKGYSAIFCEPGEFDYTSAYILNGILGTVGITMLFVFRYCVQTGRIIPRGRMERQTQSS